jgi:hypothetical protein
MQGFWLFGYGRLLEGRIAGGKRIAKEEFLASLRAKTLRKLKGEHGTVQVWGQRL